MALKADSTVIIGGKGLSGEEAALLGEACALRGWIFDPFGGVQAKLLVVGPGEGVAVIEALVRSGHGVVALLDNLGAAQVAPSLRAGAIDCLVRPLNLGKAVDVLARCLKLGDLSRQIHRAEQSLWQDLAVTRIVGESPAILTALGKASEAADFPVDVLILGETGTGKELMARFLHERSGRRLAPFVAVDCGAIHEELADSLLFGHCRGAFTGAVSDYSGLLEQADGGTLFLDEVGNLSAAVQAKLLRALQNREIWRLGDTTARPVEFRVLAATHVDLEKEATQGRFRLDLYHRLADLKIGLPPLRERGQDITLLARLFLERHRSRFGLGPCQLSFEALTVLQGFDWPGNVRQLENAMKQAAVLADTTVLTEHLPQEVLAGPRRRVAAEPAGSEDDLELPEGVMPLWELEQRVTTQVERRAIQAALQACSQDRDRAAAALDIHPKTLARKMKAQGF